MTPFALLLFGWLAAATAAELRPRASLSLEEHAQFSVALDAFRTGDWQTAIQGFGSKAAQASIVSDYAQLFLAESLSRTGDLAAARQVAGSLARSESDSLLVSQALLLAARAASREGDEAGVEQLLRQLLSRFPQRPEAALAQYLLGLALEAQGRAAEATFTFRDLWVSAPATGYGVAAGDRLGLLADKGVLLPAFTFEERLERAERLLAGGVLDASKQEAEALLAERLGSELAFRAFRVVAQSLRRSGQHGAAARAVERTLAVAPPSRQPQLLLELGRLRRMAEAPGSALDPLDRLIRQFPREPETAAALVLKGEILEETGQLNEAIRAYRQARAEFPDHEASGHALWRLGWIAYLRGDFTGAGSEFSRLAESPGSRAYRLGAAYWAGRSRDALGEYGEAERLFRLILAEAPRSYYGVLAERRARVAEKGQRKTLPAALPPDPLAPLATDLRFAKAEALRALGLTHHASVELEELFASSLADPPKLYGLSALWVRDGQYHLALRILRRHFVDLAWSGHPDLPRAFWEIFYPLGWGSDLREVAERKGLDWSLLAAVVREESSFFPQARSRVGARGLMQLMPQTARRLALRHGLAFGDGRLLDEPRPNLELGAEFLSGLLREFGDPRLALAAYNAGPQRVRKWWGARRSDDLETFVEQIPFEETRQFVKRVLVSWEEYRRIYRSDR